MAAVAITPRVSPARKNLKLDSRLDELKHDWRFNGRNFESSLANVFYDDRAAVGQWMSPLFGT